MMKFTTILSWMMTFALTIVIQQSESFSLEGVMTYPNGSAVVLWFPPSSNALTIMMLDHHDPHFFSYVDHRGNTRTNKLIITESQGSQLFDSRNMLLAMMIVASLLAMTSLVLWWFLVKAPRSRRRPLRHYTIAEAKAVLPSAWELLTDDDDEDYEEDSKVESAENCDSELAIRFLPALSIVTPVETIAIDIQVIADRRDDDDHDLQEMPLLLLDDENKVLQDDSLMNNAVVVSSENHLEFFLLEEEPAEANNFASEQVAAFAIQDVVSAETAVTNTNLVESKFAAAVPDGIDDSTSSILVIEETVSITEKDKVAEEAIHWDQHLNVCSDHFKTVCVSVLGQSPIALNDDNKKSITVAEPLVQVLNKSRTPYFFDDEPASCTLYDDSELVQANEQAWLPESPISWEPKGKIPKRWNQFNEQAALAIRNNNMHVLTDICPWDEADFTTELDIKKVSRRQRKTANRIAREILTEREEKKKPEISDQCQCLNSSEREEEEEKLMIEDSNEMPTKNPHEAAPSSLQRQFVTEPTAHMPTAIAPPELGVKPVVQSSLQRALLKTEEALLLHPPVLINSELQRAAGICPTKPIRNTRSKCNRNKAKRFSQRQRA